MDQHRLSPSRHGANGALRDAVLVLGADPGERNSLVSVPDGLDEAAGREDAVVGPIADDIDAVIGGERLKGRLRGESVAGAERGLVLAPYQAGSVIYCDGSADEL